MIWFPIDLRIRYRHGTALKKTFNFTHNLVFGANAVGHTLNLLV